MEWEKKQHGYQANPGETQSGIYRWSIHQLLTMEPCYLGVCVCELRFLWVAKTRI